MLQIPAGMAFARSGVRRGLRYCGGGARVATTEEEGEAYRKWGREVKEEWLSRNCSKNPLLATHQVRWWQQIPAMQEGCHVLDIAGLCRDGMKLAEINTLCREIEAETGVVVRLHLYGDIWSHTTNTLARKVGDYEMSLLDDPHENYVLIVASRKEGTLHTHVGKGVWHVLHPWWLRQEFNRLFKDEGFVMQEWDHRLQSYVFDMKEQLVARKGFVRSDRGRKKAFPLYKFLHANFIFILLGLGAVYLVIEECLAYRAYWALRYCPTRQEYMVAHHDPLLMRAAMTPLQRKEYSNNCVVFRLWMCPSDVNATEAADGTPGSTYVEEVKWNSLRDDCLKCMKCGCRCSRGRREVAKTPDGDNFGEALNIRECMFCGYTEAWTSMMSANKQGSDHPDHSRPLSGNYGSGLWITFKMSYLGRMLYGADGAPAAELRKDGAGELAHKNMSYKVGGSFLQSVFGWRS
eukprot:TRINITY_DN28348_c0_g1_i1.p1 TRINITY_DN28348_c0_g1~~TRINITY_DN28348_c0_g1_i1.p1  ORF type:complete len:462 (+),score=180.08 TRINITY_DN28348_c0_g1_i1:61-1446(+)